MILIVAPHCDDEIIGCFTTFAEPPEIERKVLFVDHTPERWKEAEKAARALNFTPEFKVNMTLKSFLMRHFLDSEVSQVFVPDPHWELHPLHKAVGAMGTYLCREEGIPVGVYSTNMNAPYIRELDRQMAVCKREALNRCYPSQELLWRTDHRYWLFEGRTIWDV